MKVLVRAIYSIIFLFIPLACTNYDDDIISLKESISAIEIINQEQSNLISSLQEQIDEIKRQQEQDKLAAEAYINSAISSISQLSDIIDGLTSNFINQAANLALLQVDIETIEEQILDLESQLNLIDSTGDISEINDLLSDIQDNINNNSGSINSLISRISNLELDSDKYDSDIVGCYEIDNYDNEVSIKFLKNGIGYVDYYEMSDYFTQLFSWEKQGNSVKVMFGDIIELAALQSRAGYYFEGEHIVEIEMIERNNILYKTITLELLISGDNWPFTFIDCQWFYPD